MSINVELVKRTPEKMSLYQNPRVCDRCKVELMNMSYLMMGPDWRCDKCGRGWMQVGYGPNFEMYIIDKGRI